MDKYDLSACPGSAIQGLEAVPLPDDPFLAPEHTAGLTLGDTTHDQRIKLHSIFRRANFRFFLND